MSENKNVVIEEKKENRFTKHLKKHKSVYMTAAVSGVAITGMKLSMNRKIAIAAYSAYRLGMRDEANIMWNRLTSHVKAGKLVMDLVGTTDDEILNHNMELLKELVEAGEE